MSATLHLERNWLLELAGELMDGHVSYKFGSKPLLTKEPSEVTSADCSGFVRYLLYRASDMQIKIPAGSWNQEDWCKKTGLPKVEYSTAANNDGWLRIAYLPKKNGHPRHVWLILNGRTIESRGGVGPDRRAWDTPVLKNNAHACFKLAQMYTLELGPITVNGLACCP